MPPTLFTLVSFEIESVFLHRLAWTMILLFILPVVAGMIACHHIQLFFHSDRVLEANYDLPNIGIPHPGIG
jgi:hypothetical protein